MTKRAEVIAGISKTMKWCKKRIKLCKSMTQLLMDGFLNKAVYYQLCEQMLESIIFIGYSQNLVTTA